MLGETSDTRVYLCKPSALYSLQSQVCKTPDLCCCNSAVIDNWHSYSTQAGGVKDIAFVSNLGAGSSSGVSRLLSCVLSLFSPFSMLPWICSQLRRNIIQCVPAARSHRCYPAFSCTVSLYILPLGLGVLLWAFLNKIITVASWY